MITLKQAISKINTTLMFADNSFPIDPIIDIIVYYSNTLLAILSKASYEHR